MISNPQQVKKTNTAIRLIALVIIVMLVCLAIFTCANPLKFVSLAIPISSEMQTFRLEQDKIEFEYPKNWHAYLTPEGNHGDLEAIALITAPVPTFQTITVARKSFLGDVTAVSDWGTSRVESSFAQYKLESQTSFSSNYISGLISEYTVSSESLIASQDIRCKDLYFVHEQNGYAYSFCAYESDWEEVSPLFDKIIQSIRTVE